MLPSELILSDTSPSIETTMLADGTTTTTSTISTTSTSTTCGSLYYDGGLCSGPGFNYSDINTIDIDQMINLIKDELQIPDIKDDSKSFGSNAKFRAMLDYIKQNYIKVDEIEKVFIKINKHKYEEEYERGIEDGKIIAEHGTTMWQE